MRMVAKKLFKAVWMRNNSALNTTFCLSLFLLPFGRPGFFFSPAFLTFLASTLFLLTNFGEDIAYDIINIHS